MVHMMISILQVVVIAHTQEVTKRLCGLLDTYIQRPDAKEPEILFCKLIEIIELGTGKCG